MISNIQGGFIQFQPQIGQPDANRSALEKLIKLGSNSDLLVMPELANSGYNVQSKEEAFALSENLNASPTLELLKTLAAQNELLLACGILEEDRGKLYNTAVLVDPSGLIGKYRKVHLFWNEFDFFQPGDLGFPVFDTDYGRIGMLICFDWIFPEAWRILALKGADVICHPSNLVLPYAQQAVPVHCLTNRVFTITANRYGEERGVHFSGKSIIASPEGITLAEAPENEDAVVWQNLQLDHARNKQITPRNHVFRDRIPSVYDFLTETSMSSADD
jgi:predicted amidohydrolase